VPFITPHAAARLVRPQAAACLRGEPLRNVISGAYENSLSFCRFWPANGATRGKEKGAPAGTGYRFQRKEPLFLNRSVISGT
jgi:hypothetical protein